MRPGLQKFQQTITQQIILKKIISPSSEKINIDDVIRAIDQPSIDGINTWLVSKLASSEVKVVMSGLGR